MKRLCVLYFCDKGLHEETLFSIASFARVSGRPVDIIFAQANYELSPPPALFDYLSSKGHQLIVETISYNEDDSWKGPNHIKEIRHFKTTSYHKIDAINFAADQYDWVFYVDGDTLFLSDPNFDRLVGFSEMIGACYDISRDFGVWNEGFLRHCKINGVSNRYFNAGFLCINSARWKDAGFQDAYQDAARKHADECPYYEGCDLVDQCLWNLVMDGRWHSFDPVYNTQASCLHSGAWQRAIMRHYTGPKPKFLPVRNRRCDPTEHALLRELNAECDLGQKFQFYDYGLSYFLNSIRRRQYCKRVDKYVGEVSAICAEAKSS